MAIFFVAIHASILHIPRHSPRIWGSLVRGKAYKNLSDLAVRHLLWRDLKEES